MLIRDIYVHNDDSKLNIELGAEMFFTEQLLLSHLSRLLCVSIIFPKKVLGRLNKGVL